MYIEIHKHIYLHTDMHRHIHIYTHRYITLFSLQSHSKQHFQLDYAFFKIFFSLLILTSTWLKLYSASGIVSL